MSECCFKELSACLLSETAIGLLVELRGCPVLLSSNDLSGWPIDTGMKFDMLKLVLGKERRTFVLDVQP